MIEPSILVNEHTYTLNFKRSDLINFATEGTGIGVEIRCIKLDGEHFFEHTWPDRCCIRLNGKTIKEIKPLHQNSSLKKRRDEKLFLKSQIKFPNTNLAFIYENCRDGKNTKTGRDPNYVFTVGIVKKLDIETLSQKIMTNNEIDIDSSKTFIKDRFYQKNDIQISEVKADLICKITYTRISKPVRGKYCRHINCFSLDFFLLSMENNAIRKWMCPLCKKRCSKLIYDSYFDHILQESLKDPAAPEFVTFFKNGDWSFKDLTLAGSGGASGDFFFNKNQVAELGNQTIASIRTTLIGRGNGHGSKPDNIMSGDDHGAGEDIDFKSMKAEARKGSDGMNDSLEADAGMHKRTGLQYEVFSITESERSEDEHAQAQAGPELPGDGLSSSSED